MYASLRRSLFSAYRSWCPRCLEEWSPEAYEPLIWRLGDMPRSMGPRTLLLASSEAISAPMLIEPYHVTLGVRGTEGSATRLLRLLVDAMVYFMKPGISGHFAPAAPRLLNLIGAGRNLLLDSAPGTYDAYETFRRSQGSDFQLKQAETAFSVALNLLIRIRSRWNFERQLARMAGKIALESGVSTILARKCLRTAIYLLGLKTRAEGTSTGAPWAAFADERVSPDPEGVPATISLDALGRIGQRLLDAD